MTAGRFVSSSYATAALAAALLALPAPSHAQDNRQAGGVGLTVFADAGFRGTSATFREDVSNFQQYGLNDRVSSIRVGPGELWEVCEHADFGGRCQVFSGAESDLRDLGWNDIVSSARRLRDNAGGRGRGRGFPPVPPRAGLELFSRRGFGGERIAITGDQSDLRRLGFNDQAMSLRLSPGSTWEVCVDIEFQNCLVVNTDWDDLRGVNLLERISSVRPWRQTGGGRPPGQSQGRLVLFADRGYRGRAFTLDSAQGELSGFGNQAESAQVSGGAWEMCDQSGFRGRCVIVSEDVPDLGNLGLLNAVESARPRSGVFQR